MSDMLGFRRSRTFLPVLVLSLAPAALFPPAAPAAPAAGQPGPGVVTGERPAAEEAGAVLTRRTAIRRTDNRTTYRAIAATTPPPAVSLATWAVADLDTGRILAAHGQHVRRQPASTLKLLTSLTAARRVPAEPAHRVTWAEAHPEFCICVGLDVGQRYARDSLMAAMLLPSANDAAEAMAGSDRRGRTAFLRAMNRRAERLGMTRTRAINPHGLTAYGASSTARDLLVLLRAAQADAVVAPFLGMRTASFGPLGRETRTITRSNSYVDRFRRAEQDGVHVRSRLQPRRRAPGARCAGQRTPHRRGRPRGAQPRRQQPVGGRAGALDRRASAPAAAAGRAAGRAGAGGEPPVALGRGAAPDGSAGARGVRRG